VSKATCGAVTCASCRTRWWIPEASNTWIPRAILESLGIGAERIERFVTADGRVIAREMGYAIVHAGGTRTSDEVVFAEPGDMVLLGAHTIEGMNLRVDLKEKRLVPAGPVPAAAAGARSFDVFRLSGQLSATPTTR
jgi:hypothetical protein